MDTSNFCRRIDVQIGCTLLLLILSTVVLRQNVWTTALAKGARGTISVLVVYGASMVFFHVWRIAIILVCCAYVLWHVLAYTHQRRKAADKKRFEDDLDVHPKLAYPADSNNYFTSLQESQPQPFVFPESNNIEEKLNDVLQMILAQFLHSWYDNISRKALFPRSVELLLRRALIHVRQRLASTDLIGIIVRKAIPIVTQHLHEVSVAEAQVRSAVQTVQIDALEHNSICDRFAENCKRGDLHPAAQTPGYNAVHVLLPENKLQSYLRDTVEKILPKIFPAQELGSAIVKTLLREILACGVLQPIFNLLSDPDFWNQTIVTHAHQAIQERARVKRFRHVLIEQTRHPLDQKRSMKKKPMRNLERLMLSNEAKDWDRLYRKIKKSQSLADVSRMRSEMILLKSEMAAAGDVIDSVDHHGSGNVSKSDHYHAKAMVLLQARMAALAGHSAVSTPKPMADATFDTTLATGMSYFYEFMERRDRAELLDFWQHILHCEVVTTDTPQNSQSLAPAPEIQLTKEDIARIFHTYFDSSLLTIVEDEKTHIYNYLINEPDSYDITSNEMITAVARRAYLTMEMEDFPIFKRDKLYFSMISANSNESGGQRPLIRSSSSSAVAFAEAIPKKTRLTRSQTGLEDLRSEYLSSEMIGTIDPEREVLEALDDALHEEVLPLDNMAGLSFRGRADLNISDLRTPEPGDLSVIEQIDRLDKEIAKRETSIGYIDSFLKRDIDDVDRRTANKSRREMARELESLISQKRQYEADDHSLFGRTNIRIEHVMTHKDSEGNDYTVYMIEVRRTGPDGIEAGWIITRRYSEFNELHSQLKHEFPSVANLEFPKKQLNRLKSVADVRRPVLESFLQSLLRHERICQSRVLRTFLSQNNETVKKRHHKSMIENIVGLTDPREAFSRLFTMLEGSEEPTTPFENPDLRQVHPAPQDLPDEELSSFAKPIVDLILEAFELREKSKWIKKKAVVLVLQQILGGTIESRVRDQLGAVMEERYLAGVLDGLRDQLANMSNQDSLKGKSKAEKQRQMELARQTLLAYNPTYMPETAAKKVFRALQIKTLNLHLLGKLTDQLIESIF